MRKIVIFLLKIYRSISFMFPSQCLYIPTCSEYAKEAFLKYSFLKASKLSLFRIIRCNPLSKGGFDPIKSS
ncbi:MAG: membrane protein insertion efficiency factor YidD [Candidatus Omnitrophica bacterium]|nr:membrane protein insertion efficiency factor YidD [Candidatus Omnitrophota bacterium]MCK5393460.1 membrane protein insertion efficiency factor YidD [Candidatus Omnitrophota bacterium]